MLNRSRRNFVVGALAALSVMFTGVTSKAAPASDTELVKMLRAGGLVIVLRHGATFPDQADTDPLNFDNLAAQRHLNAKGEAAAKALGEALRGIGVPVGKVYTSKFDRAYQTAVLAGLSRIEKTADVTEGGLVVSPNENSRRAKAFLTLLATVPEPDTNTIIITHKPNIVDALGKDWLDVKEGEAGLFRPENGSYALVARLQMDEWQRLAQSVMTGNR
jgi:broad specificity phosphatase PhoE